MKRFLTRLTAFCLLQLAGFSFFWGNALPGEQNYLARTIEKHARLRSAARPRLILVGGSNVAFGFLGDKLAISSGLTVVNMGLAAGLGLEFMLNEVRGQIRPGDVVVLSPEYDFGGGGRDDQVIKQLLELRPASARYLSAQDWAQHFADSAFNWSGGYLRRVILGRRSVVTEGAYRRDGFDESNGYVAHHGLGSELAARAQREPLAVRTVVHPLEAEVYEMLREFSEYCHRTGAICLFSCPPQPPDLLDGNLAEVKQLLAPLKGLEQLRVIDTPEEQIYPLHQFYDTQYHLTKEGAARRTQLLLDHLNEIRQ